MRDSSKIETSARPPKPRLTWPDRGRRMALAALAGVLVFLSFPLTTERDSGFWPLAWVALVPLFEALRGLTGKQGFWMGAWAGLVTNFGGFWWVSEVLRDFGHLPGYVYWPLTLLNSFYQGLMFAVFGLLYARAQRRALERSDDPTSITAQVPIWKTAALYTVVEWLFPMIFPWYLANGQYTFLPAIQIAELGGVMAVTFTMVAFNAGLHRLVAHRLRGEVLPRRALILTFVGTALVLVYGQVRVGMVEADMAEADKLTLGLVEADIGIFEKQAKHLPDNQRMLTLHRNLLKHQHMSAELEAKGVDLVVWPESSFFPLDDPFIKRSDVMAYALTPRGLMASTDDPATERAAWAPAPGFAEAPPARALTAAREDAVGLLVDDGVWARVGTEVASSRSPALRDPSALALVEAPTYAAHDDGAKLVAWVATRAGQLATARLGEPLELQEVVAPYPLRALAMRTGRDGVAVGDKGTLVEIERGKARLVTPADGGAALPTSDLTAVAWGPERAVALAVGKQGAVLLRMRGQWTLEAAGTEQDLTAVTFSDRGEPWIGGRAGLVRARIAAKWVDVSLPEPSDVTALTITPLGEVLAATAGAVYRRPAYAPVASTTWTREALTGVSALAPADWVQSRPLPRDVRWVRQSLAPLPSLASFDADPAGEIGEVAERDRAAVQRGYTTPILFGGLTWEPNTTPGARKNVRMYNTAILLDHRGRVRGTYDKVYLLAFGEYMPFGDLFPDLYKMFPQAGDFTAGTEVKAFDHFGRRIGVMICYEDIMVDFTGKLADLEPNVIINVTNDAWFGKTSEPWLHLALAVFRSVENRLSLVRSTNTGVSAFIEPTGRVTATTRLEDAETLIAPVPMMDGGTVYSSVGNVFAVLLLGALCLDWGYTLLLARRRRASRETAA